jgi:hypothetical protein
MPAQFLWLSLLLWASFSWAGGLTTPFGINTTQVLPKGVRSVSVSGVNTTVDTWYNNVGMVTGVAEPMNQALTYSRLLQAENDENLRLNVESQLRSQGVDLDTVAGYSTADVKTRVFVTVPSVAYGVTDRLTIGIALPIVYANMEASTGFVGTPELQQLVSEFSQKSRKQTKIIQEKLTDVIATELAGKNYRPLVNQEQTYVGDLRAVAKYLAYKSLNYSWALTNTLAFPTAQVPEIDRMIDPTPGDGQFDWGITSTIEVPITARWRFVHDLGYTMQFADTRATRIPHDEYERLSRDQDPGARRKLGDIVFTSVGGLYSPVHYLTFAGSYTAAYKERDQWRGTLASPDRYRARAVETEQYMQALYLQASLSTVQAYRTQDFPIPMMTTLGYGQIVDGRNVRNDPMWNMNMTVFF